MSSDTPVRFWLRVAYLRSGMWTIVGIPTEIRNSGPHPGPAPGQRLAHHRITGSGNVSLVSAPIADSRNTLVSDCTIVDRGGGKMLAAIQVAGKCPGTVIRGNIVGKGSLGEIVAEGAVVEGNHPATR